MGIIAYSKLADEPECAAKLVGRVACRFEGCPLVSPVS
jgi:hypothetical protein